MKKKLKLIKGKRKDEPGDEKEASLLSVAFTVSPSGDSVCVEFNGKRVTFPVTLEVLPKNGRSKKKP